MAAVRLIGCETHAEREVEAFYNLQRALQEALLKMPGHSSHLCGLGATADQMFPVSDRTN